LWSKLQLRGQRNFFSPVVSYVAKLIQLPHREKKTKGETSKSAETLEFLSRTIFKAEWKYA
jgi:hypothetical protein